MGATDVVGVGSPCRYSRPSLATTLTVIAVMWAGCCCHLASTFACPPAVCTCRWKGGKETAECVGKRLDKIPSGLSRGTQVLDISKNNLKELQKEAFSNEGLLNLQKVHVTECKIRKIHDNAFSHLANLVELDLSHNLLIAIPSETFVDYSGLRRLHLNDNPIRRVESNAFVKLPSLANLELSKCILEYVGPRAFHGLHHLQNLKLNGNNLTTLPADVGFPIPSLLSLDLFDNPWLCDCRLRILRNWLNSEELPVNAPPKCAKPARLNGRPLAQVLPEEFACLPLVAPSQSAFAIAEAFIGESASLVCSVHADPPADVRWMRHGRPLVNVTASSKATSSDQRSGRTSAVHYVVHERGTIDRTSVLTMSMINGEEDAGEYLCTAENVAGQVVINVTLEVSVRHIEASSLSNGHIAGLSVGLIVVSAATIVFICILLAKMRRQRSDESKHLHDLDRKKHHQQHASSNHVVNHVKFDVTKEKLELTSNNSGENNSVHKPLCPQTNTNNYSSNLPPPDTIHHLEDSIGGCFRSSSNSSVTSTRLMGSKPDVVNITCGGRSPTSPTSPPDEGTAIHSGGHVPAASRRGNVSRQNSGDDRSPPPPTPLGGANSVFRDGESDYFDRESPTLYYSSCKDGLITSSSFRSPSNDEEDRRLCDYVQLYEETCSAAATATAQRSTPPGGSGLNSAARSSPPPPPPRERKTIYEEDEDGEWRVPHHLDERGDDGESDSVVQGAPPSCRRWYGSVEDNDKQVLVVAAEVGGMRNNPGGCTTTNNSKNNKSGRQPPAVPAKPRYGPLMGNAGPGILKHVNLHGRNYVPVLPPLPVHHFAQARDSPDEGYEDEVEEEMDM